MGSVGDAYDNANGRELLLHPRGRAAQPPPVRIPGRGQDGLLQLHRGLVQSGAVAFGPGIPLTDNLRSRHAGRHDQDVDCKLTNRPPNRVNPTTIFGARSSRPSRWPACSASGRRRCSKPHRPSAQRPRYRSRNPEPPPFCASHAPKAALTMATNFFQQQDSARRKTFLLVVYFVLAILILIALVYGLL